MYLRVMSYKTLHCGNVFRDLFHDGGGETVKDNKHYVYIVRDIYNRIYKRQTFCE